MTIISHVAVEGIGDSNDTISKPPLIPFLADAFSSVIMKRGESGQHHHHYHQQHLKKMMTERGSHQFHVTTLSTPPPLPLYSTSEAQQQPKLFPFVENVISNASDYFLSNNALFSTSPMPSLGFELAASTATNDPVVPTGSDNGNLTAVNNGEGHFIEDKTLTSLPLNFTEISDLNKYCIIVYTILFLLAAVSNLLVLSCVSRHDRLGKSRTHLLIMHLCIADLIVTFFLMPTEIFWRITIAWKGGDILCKLCQFIRAFGLYLSSNVVISISIDRYFAIVYPLKLAGAVRRVKWMLVGAWIVSAVFAGPQMFIYHVASHPVYPEFRQCVTKAFLKTDPYNELIYNVSSVSALYFIPLLVIIYTYTMILWKIHKKSKEHQVASQQETTGADMNSPSNQIHNGPSSTTNTTGTNRFLHPSSAANLNQLEANGFHRRSSSILSRSASKRSRLMLRSSANQTATLSRARSRTLRLTLLILLSFILCYSPYCYMTLWYMLDRGAASQVDERLQEALFIMVVTNSMLNPLIYNSFRRKQECQKRLTALLHSSPWTERLVKWMCCCPKRCCEQRENNCSETVILTLNNRTNNGSGRRKTSHGTITATATKSNYNHVPAPPSPHPRRSQIVTLRRESGFVVRFIRNFGNNNGIVTTLAAEDDSHDETLLTKPGTDECMECRVVTVHPNYVNPILEIGSSSSQGTTPV